MNIKKEIIKINERLTALEKSVNPSVDKIVKDVSSSIKGLAESKRDTLPKAEEKT